MMESDWVFPVRDEEIAKIYYLYTTYIFSAITIQGLQYLGIRKLAEKPLLN
jgi:hypothetical protein